MRINKFVASASGMSRRRADMVIQAGRVHVNGLLPSAGQAVTSSDMVTLDNKPLQVPTEHTTIMLNKPIGYVCSRAGQGSHTIYELLPPELDQLKPVGRLDKDSSGLLLLTDDGQLAYELTHPKFMKTKLYEVVLNAPLQPLHRQMISEHGLQLEDGPSQFRLERLVDGDDTGWRVIMHQGRNRQIRRTFAAVGYQVVKLHRTQFGNYSLGDITPGHYKTVTIS